MVAPVTSLAASAVDALGSAASKSAKPTTGSEAKMRATSQDFEAVFLNTMFQQMFTGADGDGPVGGSTGTGVWRSFLTDEYAKTFTKAGGIGIADDVYRSLLARQEATGTPDNKPGVQQ